jgi:CRISPR/Cas system CMR-associated protein Cmr5 small subunit
MQNLDQIRAAAALAAAKAKSGNKFEFTRADVAGFPALIIQNGLLAAFAYAAEDGKTAREGLKFACDQTTAHLANPIHGIAVLANQTTASAAIVALSSAPATSLDLQRATAEALVFFGYLKRFAEKEQPRSQQS